MIRVDFEPQDTSVGLLSATRIAPGVEEKARFLKRIGKRFNPQVTRTLEGGISVHSRLSDRQWQWKQLIDDNSGLAARSLQKKDDLPSNRRRKNDPFTADPSGFGLEAYGLSNGTGESTEYHTLGKDWIAVSEHGLEEDHDCAPVSSGRQNRRLVSLINPDARKILMRIAS